MAKKQSTLRVHQLAKEIGVSSKDVVAKCQAEGIPNVTNHMSSISLGLSQTIREWFGEAEAGTAVETAERVDVEAAKRRAAPKRASRKSARTADGDDAPTTADSSATATLEDEPKQSKPTAAPAPGDEGGDDTTAATRPAAAPKTIEPAAEADAPAAPVAEEPTPEVETEPDATPAVAASAPDSVDDVSPSPEGAREDAAADGDEPKMNVPERPTDVKPVGPMLETPKKISLAGPRVIRIEKPEDLPAPRARGTGGGGGMARGGPRTGAGAGGFGPDAPPGGFTGRGGGRGGGGGAGRGGAGGRNDRRRNDSRPGRSFQTGGAGGPAAPGGGGGRFEPWREQDLIERDRRLSTAGGFLKRHRQDRQRGGGGRNAPAAPPSGPIKITEPISIKELSAATGVKASDILRQMMMAGTMATINAAIETEQAIEIMMAFDIELDVVEQKSAAELIEDQFKDREREDEQSRAPVVTILGHVDHGKTSLLDRIRNTNVASGEAGGITQATSAFTVPVKAGDRDRVVTFIDTPGHEAFTNMRARGAKATDIAVLVIAADDGVMPQSIESIAHAKAAEVPIVVALNKIDRPDATDENIQRILGQLAEHGLNPTDWGGDTEVIRTSAIRGDGVQDLLDTLDYQAELLELKADFGGRAEGVVLEAQMEEGRGAVARMLVQEGVLHKGDFVVVGRGYGRVRDIVDDRGKRIEEAGPSTPVAISGIDQLPDAGDKFYAVGSIKEAEHAAEERRRVERERELTTPKVTLDNIFAKFEEAKMKELPLVVKADVQGSVETLRAVLAKIGSDEVRTSVKHAAVGGITESDIMLAEASGAIVFGFNVTTSAKARQLAEQRGVEVRLYDVIYDLTDDVQKAASGLLAPELKLEVLGHAEVRAVFRVSKVGAVAGCYVTDGVVERHAQIRVTRDGIVVEKDRRLEQLKRFKDDAKEVRAGQECGMKIDGYDDIREGDVLECYRTISVARSL